LSTSLEMLAVDGVDGLSMQKISSATGPCNGPLSGRDLWGLTLRPYLELVLDELGTYYPGETTELPLTALSALSEPGREAKALIEVLAVTRRFPFAGETIRQELAAALER